MSAVRVIPDDGRATPPVSPPLATEELPGALLDRLRRSAEKAREDRHLDKPVPGFGGDLVLRFKPLDIGQLERFVESRRAGRVSEISEGIDALATCCVAVFGSYAGTTVELPALLDHRLAVLLNMPFPPGATLTAREVVLMLFGGEAFALGKFVDEVVEWMADLDGNGQPSGEG
jgi:hypothetical protein